jgi:hypothetical protein
MVSCGKKACDFICRESRPSDRLELMPGVDSPAGPANFADLAHLDAGSS